MLKFEKGACFFYLHNPYFYIFSPQKQDRIVALSSALVPKKCNFIAPPALIMQFLIAQFFPFLPPTMLYVEYITLHIYIANCNRINSVWVQCDNTAAKLFIGLLYKCNKFQKKNCPKTTGKCCYVFLETKEN